MTIGKYLGKREDINGFKRKGHWMLEKEYEYTSVIPVKGEEVFRKWYRENVKEQYLNEDAETLNYNDAVGKEQVGGVYYLHEYKSKSGKGMEYRGPVEAIYEKAKFKVSIYDNLTVGINTGNVEQVISFTNMERDNGVNFVKNLDWIIEESLTGRNIRNNLKNAGALDRVERNVMGLAEVPVNANGFSLDRNDLRLVKNFDDKTRVSLIFNSGKGEERPYYTFGITRGKEVRIEIRNLGFNAEKLTDILNKSYREGMDIEEYRHACLMNIGKEYTLTDGTYFKYDKHYYKDKVDLKEKDIHAGEFYKIIKEPNADKDNLYVKNKYKEGWDIYEYDGKKNITEDVNKFANYAFGNNKAEQMKCMGIRNFETEKHLADYLKGKYAYVGKAVQEGSNYKIPVLDNNAWGSYIMAVKGKKEEVTAFTFNSDYNLHSAGEFIKQYNKMLKNDKKLEAKKPEKEKKRKISK